jgi:hypothetical protein
VRQNVLPQAEEHLFRLRIPRRQTQKVYVISHADGWSLKTQNRKGTGTGRTRYLKTIPRVYKNQIKGLKN